MGYDYDNSGPSPPSFEYNGGEYSTVSVAGAYETLVRGISGNNIVGYFSASYGSAIQGFLYNNGGYVALNGLAGAYGTVAYGVSGSSVVGWCELSSGIEGFLYNNGNYTALNVPGADQNTTATAIDGNNIVGYYSNGSNIQGFLAVPVPEPSIVAFDCIGIGLLAIFRLASSRAITLM